jgi:hypothetical protein
MEKRHEAPFEVSRVARGSLEVLVALGSATVVLLTPSEGATHTTHSAFQGISTLADTFQDAADDGGRPSRAALSHESQEGGLVDVSAWFSDLIALGILLGTDSSSPEPSEYGAESSTGGVVGAALQMRGPLDGVSITVIRLGDSAGSEALSVNQALTLAAAAVSEILDPPEATAAPEIPLGS